MPWQDSYLKKFYYNRPSWQDGTSVFFELCSSSIPKDAKILEIGSGPTNPVSTFLSSLGELTGADVSEEHQHNTALRRVVKIEKGRLALENASFDACVSNYVLEHVDQAELHFFEVFRVLKPGGVYLFRTPNRFHYTALIAGMTPHWFHVAVANRLRGLPQEAHDPYPTVYRCNTRHQVERLAQMAGFEIEKLLMVEKEPSYGLFARPAFMAGMLYERTVNATERLADLRANLFGVLRKS